MIVPTATFVVSHTGLVILAPVVENQPEFPIFLLPLWAAAMLYSPREPVPPQPDHDKFKLAPGAGNLSNTRWRSLLMRTCLVIGLFYCMYLVARQAVGAWYFRKSLPDAVQTAIKWDPGNPEYYDALATLTHLYSASGSPDNIVRLCETATRLSPFNALYWADLGAAYEWAGRKNDALRAFNRARNLFPNSPDINWRLANFYIRAGQTSEGLDALRKVLLADSITPRQVFVLATNATRDNKTILQMLPSRAAVFLDYLNFQIEMQRIDAAEQVWARLLELKLPFELPQSFPYLDALIQHQELDKLAEAWSALGERFPANVRARTPGGNLVTNGDFESEILNGGLDWRVIPMEGATVSLDSSNGSIGARSLRIDFDGTRNLNYGHVLQYVPVMANTRYRFRADTRTQDVTTDSGPKLEVCDAYDLGKVFVSTENLVGTSNWSSHQFDFQTARDTHLLIVRVARLLSHKLGNRVAGTVWIARVSLDRVDSDVPPKGSLP